MAVGRHVSFDDRELKEFEKSLRRFPRAFAIASRNMLNGAAFQGRKVWQAQIQARMIVRARGKFGAPGSIFVDRATGGDLNRMRSVLGSIAPYMVDQEFGGTRVSQGKRGVPIPTTDASGEGRGTRPRRRLVRRTRKLSAIRLSSKRNRARTGRGRRAFLAVKIAQKAGDEFVFLDLTKAPGIYRVTKRGITLVHETKRRSVTIPKNPTLRPTIDVIRVRMPGILRAELRKQLVRNRIKWRLN